MANTVFGNVDTKNGITFGIVAYFMEADAGWYQPCSSKPNDENVPADTLCFVQPFHPGVMNILFPYEATLAKMRMWKQRTSLKPLHGKYDRSDAAASSSHAPPPKSPRTG